MLRGSLFYGAVLAPCSLLVLAAVSRLKGQSMGQWFPVALVLVMASSGLMFWTHAYFLGYYLPPGINRRLLKAAIFLSLAAIVGFYTLLLYRMGRRRYGKRAISMICFLALSSIYVVFERREAYHPPREPAPRQTSLESTSRPLLCVVGIDTASLDAVLPLSEQGRLPFFRTVLEQGAQARLTPLEPIRFHPLWTTLATGKLPYKHGIVGDFRYDPTFLTEEHGAKAVQQLPLAVGFRHWGIRGDRKSVDRREMETLPLWEVFHRLGMSTAIVGWPTTYPIQDSLQTILTDRFFRGLPERETAGDAYPEEAAERARLFRVEPAGLEPEMLSRFGPDPPERVLESLAQDQWRRDFASFLLDGDASTDAIFLYLPGLRAISEHYFGGYSAVQFRGLQDENSVRAYNLYSAYYAQLDELLSRFWESIDRPKLLVLVSAHGVGRTTGLSEIERRLRRRPASRGDLDDGSDGILMFLGEGVQQTETIRSAELVDLTPTLLYGLGFPVARDLDGSILTEVFDPAFMARRPLSFVPSYETLSTVPRDESSPAGRPHF